MAITLQLARITSAELAECRRSVAELDRLCSFEMVPMSDYLDLDWADGGIVRMCEVSGVGDAVALRKAVDGGEEVNPAYRDHAYGVMEQPTFVEPDDVVTFAGVLRDSELAQVFGGLPSDWEAVKSLLGGFFESMDTDLRPYLAEHFNALREFYRVAAARSLAVVVWWD